MKKIILVIIGTIIIPMLFAVDGIISQDLHDVGVVAVHIPPYVWPGQAVDIAVTYGNFGDFTETFYGGISLDSSGVNIYHEGIDITLDPGIDTTIPFSSWTSGATPGIVYEGYAYTYLATDMNPANDTIHFQIITAINFWNIYESMPQSSYYNACVYSDVTGAQTVWSLGGDPTYTSIFEFDCATETWSTSSATLNHEARRLAAAVVDGKIYAIGGMPGSGTTALDYCQEFDPVAGTVTDKTVMPTARHFLGALTWNDTLIYVMGGQSGSSYYSTIEIYDPANNAWTTGTAMPIQNRSFACGIQTDTIYVAGGYNGGYVSDCYMGVIDPANPQSITWTAIADIPIGSSGQAGRSRLQGACVKTPLYGWVFYFTGGDDHGSSYPAYDTWFYDPLDALWHQDFDKPTPISNSQCAIYVPNPFEHGVFFCAGGYNTATGSGTAATEGRGQWGAIQETPPNNHGLAGIGFAKMANPSKGVISYATLVSGRVVLKAYDATGRFVKTLVNAVQPAGIKIINWDTSNIANGVYFLRLDAQGEITTRKMILVK